MLQSAIYRIAYTAAMFVAGLVMANLALPAHFGSISLLLLNASVFSLVTGFGIDNTLIHLHVNRQWSRNGLFSLVGVALLVQMALFTGAALLYAAVQQKTMLSGTEPGNAWLEILYFFGLVASEKCFALLYTLHKSRTANQTALFVAAVYLAALLLLPLHPPVPVPTALQLIAGQTLLLAAGLFIALYKSLPTLRLERIKWGTALLVLRDSFQVMATNIILLLAYRVDYWFLERFQNVYAVGLFAQANKFANLMWVVPNIFALLLMPRFGRFNRKEIPLIFVAAVLCNLLTLAATLVGSGIIYSYFLNESYEAGRTALYVMLPGYFFWAAVIYFIAYFSWRGKFIYSLTASIFCLLVITAADWLLIPRYSTVGAAAANTIAYGLTLVLYLYFFFSGGGYRFAGFRVPVQALLQLLKKLAKDKE